MPPARLQIFVSSVQKELADERRAVAEYVRGNDLLKRFFDIFLFEELPASDRRADSVYLAEVARADLYLGLFGNEYGFEDAAGVSPTEREFDEATRQGRVRLIYLIGSDDSGRQPKQRALIRKAGDGLIRRRVTGIADLLAAVYSSLVEELVRRGLVLSRPFHAAACAGADLADVSTEKVRRFLVAARRERQYPLDEETPVADVLAHLNLLEGDRPSNAAILLFGIDPQRFLLSSEVKCMHFHGLEVLKPIPSYQIYRGTTFDLVDQAVDFVMSKVARSVGTRESGTQAPVEYEIPRGAVAEAIGNAVAHRDYASNASVQVMLFADRLEVWNPGELPPELTIELLSRPHASIPRNPSIADAMYLTHYAEKAGSGILDMIHLCKEVGLEPPRFAQTGGQFVQTLIRPPRSTSPVTVEVTGEVAGRASVKGAGEAVLPEDRLLAVLVEEKSRQELQNALGLKHEDHFRAAYLQPALDAGLIEMTVPGKPTSRLQKYRRTAKGNARVAGKGG